MQNPPGAALRLGLRSKQDIYILTGFSSFQNAEVDFYWNIYYWGWRPLAKLYDPQKFGKSIRVIVEWFQLSLSFDLIISCFLETDQKIMSNLVI